MTGKKSTQISNTTSPTMYEKMTKILNNVKRSLNDATIVRSIACGGSYSVQVSSNSDIVLCSTVYHAIVIITEDSRKTTFFCSNACR